jgi:hypothetical protein
VVENETNLIISTLDRANACTMRACDDFEHTAPHARLLSRRIAFRKYLPRIPRLPVPSPMATAINLGNAA